MRGADARPRAVPLRQRFADISGKRRVEQALRTAIRGDVARRPMRRGLTPLPPATLETRVVGQPGGRTWSVRSKGSCP